MKVIPRVTNKVLYCPLVTLVQIAIFFYRFLKLKIFFFTDIHGVQTKNPIYFGDSLTFHLQRSQVDYCSSSVTTMWIAVVYTFMSPSG